MVHVKKFESYEGDNIKDLSWEHRVEYDYAPDEVSDILQMGAMFIDKKHISYNWQEKIYEFDEDTIVEIGQIQDSATMGFIVIDKGNTTDYSGVMFGVDIKVLATGDHILYKWEKDNFFKQV